MSELDKLTEIIVTILGNDNQARNQGELLLKKLRESDFNTYIITFANLLNVSPTRQVRIFCVVHLRRLLSNFVESFESSQWYKLPNDTQKSLKQLFMEILSKEQDGVTRRLLCDLIGELYATIKKLSNEKKNQTGEEGKQWDSLMQNVWAFLTSGNTILMESALKILGILFIYCGQEFAQHQNDLFPILKQSLEHDDLKVKASAIEALSNYVGTVQTKQCQSFQELVPLLLNALLTILNKNEDLGVDVLSEVNDMMSAEPKLFKMHFKEFLDTLKTIHQQNYTIDTIKGSALEITVLTFEMLPKMTKDIPEVIKDFFECCFSYMVSNVEDVDKDWLSPPEGFVETNEDANPHDSAVKYAMHLIDRVMYKLGEEATMRIFSQMLVELVKVNNWQYRYAALMGLSQTGEYITDIAEMDHIVDFTLNFFKDEHPKVRYAALQCIGQFSDDSKPEFQKRYTEKILPALIEMLSDPIPRVVSHCLAALTNFLDGCEKRSVSNYILQILEPCLNFLSTAISLVKEGSMSTIATLAGACQKDFVPYWEKTAQIVFNILKDTTDKQYKQIRGQAIECLVLVGEAVGKEEFKKGSHDIIGKLIDIQKNYVDEVDPQKIYLLSGWQRICLILQEDFIPYLEDILPSLFSLVENIILGQSRRQGTNRSNETTEVIKALGGGQGENLFHKANTSESQEVSISLKMINVFVSELRKGFLPYIDKASTILTHLLQKSYNVNVKVAAAKGLPGLLRVAQESADPNKAEVIRNMSNSFIVLLWKAVGAETDAETRAIYVMMLREILRISGRFMTEQEVVIFSEHILRSLKKSDQTRIGNEELLEDEENDIDETEEEALRDETASEEDYHCVLAELIGTLFHTHQELALPLARILYSKILPNVLNNKTPSKICKFGIFLVDNMIEYLGWDLLHNEWQTLGEVVIQYSLHSKAEVRHPATYGVGLLAEKTKENYQTFAEVSLKALFASLQIAKDQHEDAVEFGMSRDNAIAAIGRIIKYQPQCINFKELTQVWFKLLPLKYDRVEAKGQHDMLMDIILHTTDPSVIFGEKGENMLHAVRVFALVVNTQYSFPEFEEKMKKVIEALVSKPETKALLQECFGKLEPPLKDKMKNILG